MLSVLKWQKYFQTFLSPSPIWTGCLPLVVVFVIAVACGESRLTGQLLQFDGYRSLHVHMLGGGCFGSTLSSWPVPVSLHCSSIHTCDGLLWALQIHVLGCSTVLCPSSTPLQQQDQDWGIRKTKLSWVMTGLRNHQKKGGMWEERRAREAVSTKGEGSERRDGSRKRAKKHRKDRRGGDKCTMCGGRHKSLCEHQLSVCDLFYLPSVCWARDEKKLMNNRGEGKMDENEFLFFSFPFFPAPLFSPHPPLFNINSQERKDFINNRRDFFGCTADVGPCSV